MSKQQNFRCRTSHRTSHHTLPAFTLLIIILVVALFAGCARGNPGTDSGGEQNTTGAAVDVATGAAVTDAAVDDAVKTETVQGADITVTSWVYEKRPDENVSIEKDLSYIDVGLGKKSGRSMGLVRFDLPSGVAPKDLVSARLSLKKKGGDEPAVRAGSVSVPWGFAVVAWNDVDGKTDFRDDSPVFEKGEGDWYALDVTDTVREWLAGERANYGFALMGTEGGKTTSFFSALGDDAADYPQLSVTYRESAPAEKYGRYGYTEAPEESGNCLSYALRDKDGIYDQDLIAGADKAAFDAALKKGRDEAVAYFKEKLSAYIDAHRKALAIESWRPLTGFDDPIDAEKEYLVEMKIGAVDGDMDEAAMSAFGKFDYHFRVRLDDGRWAEKVPAAASRVTPGSNESFDTGKYPWDAAYEWGYPKWTDYYDSPAVYFAVTKSTDDFTAHRQQLATE